MGYEQRVGRIGALAVALGVGAALAGAPALGHAAPSDSDSASQESPTSSDGATSGDSTSTPGGPSDIADAPPSVDASTGSLTVSPRDGTDDEGTDGQASDVTDVQDSDADIDTDADIDSDADIDTGEATPRDQTDATVDSSSDAIPFEPATLRAEPPERPTAPSPAEWTLLAAARREIGDTQEVTAFGPTPNGPNPQTTVPLTPPKITKPGTWLPFLSDLTYDLGVIAQRNIDIYDFATPRGWAAALLDYTWALPTTTAGNLQQVAYLFSATPPEYSDELSYHQYRHIYLGGSSSFFGDAGRTLGPVVVIHDVDPDFLPEALAHETVHVQQQRFFGPIQPVTYGVWFASGALVAAVLWLPDTSQDLKPLLYTIAYYDNPWETWAYKASGGWPPDGSLVVPKWLWP